MAQDQTAAPDRQDWRDFLLRACHDLRTPLRGIRTNAQLLIRNPEKRSGPELDQILGFMVDGASKADALVDALSNYAIAMQVQRDPQPFSVAVALRGALAKVGREIQDSGATITYGDLPRVAADPDRLMQVFENLLRNAIQYRRDIPPSIHVDARYEGGEWIFAVRDNGQGIEPQDVERLFRPFERLSRKRGGVGLGLAASREIVARHGGRIWAESAVGEGTTVFFTVAEEA
jgi:signal transduction histidine kinase